MMRLLAKEINGLVEVKAMVKHEMMTYGQAKVKGVERNFITNWVATVGDEVVFEFANGQFLSKNPVIKFKLKGIHKGQALTLTWKDLLGTTESQTINVT